MKGIIPSIEFEKTGHETAALGDGYGVFSAG